MTNHEAIQFLKNMIGEEHGRSIGAEGFYRELCAYHVDALRMAIKALEQEPCDDAISRQAALEKIHWLGLDNDTAIKCNLAIRALPSVNTQEPKTDVLDKVKGYVEHIRNTGMGKKKSLEFIDKFIEGLKAESEEQE